MYLTGDFFLILVDDFPIPPYHGGVLSIHLRGQNIKDLITKSYNKVFRLLKT